MIRNRRSIRVKGYEYSTPGAYFVTICTRNRDPMLRRVVFRKAVETAWIWSPTRFDNVELDEFVVMPHHTHFVLRLVDHDARSDRHLAAQGGLTSAPTLPNIVGAFKTVAATGINAARGTRGQPVWQRGYYEHIVRDEEELRRIRDYIRSNPLTAHTHEEGTMSQAWEPPATRARAAALLQSLMQ